MYSIFCPECSREISENDNICPYCGYQIFYELDEYELDESPNDEKTERKKATKKNEKNEKKELSQLALTKIAGRYVFWGAVVAAIIAGLFSLAVAFMGISCVSKNLESDTTSSHSSESDSINFTDNADSGSNSDSSDSSSPDSGSNSDGSDSSSSESDKKNLFPSENGRVELYDDHSGIAYIYKKYLDENPIGLIEDGEYKLMGWSIKFTCDNKSLSFNTTCQNDDESQLQCSAQYSINEEPQSIILNDLKVNYEPNGDLRIEFNFETVPFDLRDSSSDIIFYELYSKISF